MSTADLKSLLEKRRREKVDQDEREQLLKEIRELYLLQSTSTSVERAFSMLKYI